MRRSLFLFTIIITWWSFSLYFYNNPVLIGVFSWLKIALALTIITIFSLFYLIIVVSESSFQKFKTPLVISSILGLTLIFTLFVNDLLGIKSYLIGLSRPAATFLLLFLSYLGLAAAILLKSILPSPASGHWQGIYVLVAFALLLLVTTFLYLFLPLMAKIEVHLWLGPLFTIVFLLFFVLGHYLIKKVGEESERRKETERLAKEWEKLAQAKDQFILSLQHHLRTPLTPFKIYLERILEGTYGHEENPVIKEKLLEMKKLANTLYSLMESLLDIQELKMGGKILNLEDCQIENLIKGLIEELRPQAEQKGLYLKYQASPGLGPTVKVDKKRISEAIGNLVDNAIKYTEKGGVTIKLKMENLKLKIVVADTGIGMEKEEIDYFLEGRLFERGAEAKKLYGPGRGIGLSVTIEIVKAHGGKIWAESRGLGKGTTFYIELPIKTNGGS